MWRMKRRTFFHRKTQVFQVRLMRFDLRLRSPLTRPMTNASQPPRSGRRSSFRVGNRRWRGRAGVDAVRSAATSDMTAGTMAATAGATAVTRGSNREQRWNDRHQGCGDDMTGRVKGGTGRLPVRRRGRSGDFDGGDRAGEVRDGRTGGRNLTVGRKKTPPDEGRR